MGCTGLIPMVVSDPSNGALPHEYTAPTALAIQYPEPKPGAPVELPEHLEVAVVTLRVVVPCVPGYTSSPE